MISSLPEDGERLIQRKKNSKASHGTYYLPLNNYNVSSQVRAEILEFPRVAIHDRYSTEHQANIGLFSLFVSLSCGLGVFHTNQAAN